MSSRWNLSRLAVVLILGMVVPLEANGRSGASSVIDLALTEDGRFTGRVQNHLGQRVDGAVVSLFQDGVLVAQSKSRADGMFAFTGISAGVYELSSASWRRSVRVWAVAAAPPAAQEPTIILLNETDGQTGEQPPWNEFGLSQNRDGAAKSEDSGTQLVSWSDQPPSSDTQQWVPPAPESNIGSSQLTNTFDQSNAAPVGGLDDYSYGPPPTVPPAVPEMVEAGCLGQPFPCCPPARCPAGPTIGDAVTVTTIITSVVLGAVGIYELANEKDRVRRVSSP